MCKMELTYTKLAWPELSRWSAFCSLLPYPMGCEMRRPWGFGLERGIRRGWFGGDER